MKKIIYKVLLVIFAVAMVATALFIPGGARSEGDDYLDTLNENDLHTLYVTASQLNGRASPRKTGFIEMTYERGDILKATGRWSNDHAGIEVLGGESRTVWVNAKYVTERKESFCVKARYYGKFKIRKKPFDGRVVGYFRDDQIVQIDQVVLGWGRTKKGWIDLDNYNEVTEE